MESEFVALEKAATEAEWLKNLLIDIPIWKRPAPSVSIHCDTKLLLLELRIKYTMERVDIYA